MNACSNLHFLPRGEKLFEVRFRLRPQRRTYARHWTPVHLDFVVDDVERAVANAVAAGATLERPIATYDWGKLALMADPFGHGFCFIEFLARGYDEIAEPLPKR